MKTRNYNKSESFSEALNKRAVNFENKLNIFRAVYLLLFGILDMYFAFFEVTGNQIPYLQIAIFGIVIIAFLIFIHKMTSGGVYRPWVAFVTTTFDTVLIFAIIIKYSQINIYNIDNRLFAITFVLFALSVIIMNGFRQGYAIVIYNTLLACVLTVFLLIAAGIPTMIIYDSIVILLLVGGTTFLISKSNNDLFIKVQLRDQLKRFLSKEVVEGIDTGLISVSLGGVEKYVTVLITDIRGFTSLSEKQLPDKVVELLNKYFTLMSKIIFNNGGSIDKYIGDAILAVFGIPERKEDDEFRAVTTAIEMRKALKEFNKEMALQNIEPVDMGVAIHSGAVIAGNIGSPERMDYTIIGDTVNTASRIEGLNKTFSTSVLISSSTYEKIKDKISARFISESDIRGREEKIRLYSI